MSLQEALAKVVARVPECRAAIYVELPSGLVLGSEKAEGENVNVAGIVSSITQLFDHPSLAPLESLFQRTRGAEDTEQIDECAFACDEQVYAVVRTQQGPSRALIVACRKTAPLADVLKYLRQEQEAVEGSV